MNKVTNTLSGGLILACASLSCAMADPVEFKILSDWGSGYSAQLKLTNESNTPMTDWRLVFDFDGDIKNLYSGRLVSDHNGHVILQGSSWNKTIAPGKSVTIGWSGGKSGVSRTLNNIEFTATDISVPTGPYAISYDLQADWGSGYVASMRVANNGEQDINGWSLSFDYPYPINQIYNGQIISHEGDRYTIEGIDEGSNLSPQEVSVFVLRGNVGGLTVAPTNISFSY